MRPREDANFGIGLGWGTLSYGSQVHITRPDTLLRYTMCQVVYLSFKETTLGQFQFEIILPLSIKNYA